MSENYVYVWKFYSLDHSLSREFSHRRLWIPGKKLRALRVHNFRTRVFRNMPAVRARYVSIPILCQDGFHGSLLLRHAEAYRGNMKRLGIFKLSGKIIYDFDKVCATHATLIVSIDCSERYHIPDVRDRSSQQSTRRRYNLKKKLFAELRKKNLVHIIKEME